MAGFGPSISARVENLFEEFYLEKAKEKAESIFIYCDEIVNRIEGDLDENFDVYLDRYKINTLVNSYYLDVIRYKEYHFNSKKSDKVTPDSKDWNRYIHKKMISENKAASLSSKWILKFLPLQIHPIKDHYPTQKQSNLILRLNAWVSLEYSLLMMGADISKIPKKLLQEIEYHMLYRAFDERHYFLVYGQIANSYGK